MLPGCWYVCCSWWQTVWRCFIVRMLFDMLLTYVILMVCLRDRGPWVCLYSGTWHSQGCNVNAILQIGIFVGEIRRVLRDPYITKNCVSFYALTPTNPLLNTTEQLGRIDRKPGAERPHLGRTWGGSTLGRIDRYPQKGRTGHDGHW